MSRFFFLFKHNFCESSFLKRNLNLIYKNKGNRFWHLRCHQIPHGGWRGSRRVSRDIFLIIIFRFELFLVYKKFVFLKMKNFTSLRGGGRASDIKWQKGRGPGVKNRPKTVTYYLNGSIILFWRGNLILTLFL